ncbi:TonB-dependent siderophore receptor [Siphonobacter sp.]|uniref:TonB-dependent siderophore receptor n=1 Tax=Siphonobacter sp. TaxID=1869184 RepID=UPI003B3A792B
MKSIFLSLVYLALLVSFQLVQAQDQKKNADLPDGVIQGVVKDASGHFLPAVHITVPSQRTGTSSSETGVFQLQLESGRSYTLHFSSVGYETQKHTVRLPATGGIDLTIVLASTSTALQQVEIVGRKETTYKTSSTFIGSKSATQIKDLPQSVSYASKELIADQGLMRVGEVVKNFSGVTQFTFYDDLTIRGFRINGQSNTQLLNGLRTSTGFWKQPLANYLERVEVLKGPSSALYGNASPGGTVNRVTKKPLDENRKSVSISLGSFNTLRTLLDFTGPANKDSSLLYRINLGYEDAQSFRDLQFDKNLIIAPSFSFLPNDKTRINFDLVYNNSKSRLDRGQSIMNTNDLYSTPTSLALSTGNDYLNEQTYNVSLSLSRKLTNWLSFNAAYMKTGYSEDLYEHRSANAYGVDATGATQPDKIAMQVFMRKRNRYIDNFSGYFNLEGSTGPLEHRVVVGYDYGSEKLPTGGSQLQASGYRNAANNGFIATYNPANKSRYLLDASGNPVPNVPHFDLSNILNSQRIQDDSKLFYAQRSFDPTYYYLNAGYIQDQIKIGRFQALLGVRYENYTDFDKYKTKDEKKTNQSAWLPRFGLVFTATSNINLYATYVQGYNPQTASNIANPNAGGPFKPLESNMVEVGGKSSWFDDRLTASFAVYQIKQKNTLYNANDPQNPDLLRQIGAEESRGFEFDIIGRILPNWSVIASYSYNKAQITETLTEAERNIQKPNAPRNMFNFWTRYSIPQGALKGLGVGFGTNFVDKRNLSISLDQSIPSFQIFNAALYYNVGRVQLQYNLNNLTNKTYWVGGYDYIRLFPGAPSNSLVTINYTF